MPGRLSHFAGDVPTAREVDRVADATERVGLVIRVRWLMLMTLVAYSAITITFYAVSEPLDVLARYIVVPAVALMIVAAYNAWYQVSYRRLSHLRYLAHGQILLDTLVATLLVHYSGGANSWFWSMYLLFTMEAAFILEEEGDTWLVATFGVGIYGALLASEYYGLIAPVQMPFVGSVGLGLAHNPTYVVILWSWVLVMNVAMAIIGNALARQFKARREELLRCSVIDQGTGTYNVEQFRKLLRGEVERAKRYRRRLALLMVAIDDFASYSEEFGHVEGSTLTKLVSEVVQSGVRGRGGTEAFDLDTVSRYSVDTFAVLAPETDVEEANYLGERLREAVEAVCGPRPGSPVRKACRVSAGVAVYPVQATDAEALLAAAELALVMARAEGGNRVSVASG